VIVLLAYAIATLFGIVLGPLILWINRTDLGRASIRISALLLPVLLCLATYFWHTLEFTKFSREAGQSFGMIATPRPRDYVNYDYKPKGELYERWAFQYPLITTAALLVAYALVTAAVSRRGRWRILAGSVLYSLGVLGLWIGSITVRYLDATAFFV